MANIIAYSSLFIKKAKRLKKKHRSLNSDLEDLEQRLIDKPRQGDDLGLGLYKVRLAVKSKGQGKSGGYRIITYLVTKLGSGDIIINMLTLFDKSEESSIDKQHLLEIIKSEEKLNRD